MLVFHPSNCLLLVVAQICPSFLAPNGWLVPCSTPILILNSSARSTTTSQRTWFYHILFADVLLPFITLSVICSSDCCFLLNIYPLLSLRDTTIVFHGGRGKGLFCSTHICFLPLEAGIVAIQMFYHSFTISLSATMLFWHCRTSSLVRLADGTAGRVRVNFRRISYESAPYLCVLLCILVISPFPCFRAFEKQLSQFLQLVNMFIFPVPNYKTGVGTRPCLVSHCPFHPCGADSSSWSWSGERVKSDSAYFGRQRNVAAKAKLGRATRSNSLA